MFYTFKDIAEITGGQVLASPNIEAPITHLLYDSRRLSSARQSLFFALAGQRQDGHDFIDQLYQNGIRNFLVSKNINIDAYPLANFLKVDQPLRSLQKLAQHHRQKFDIPVIGITGSNGKTIIKEWLYQLLHEDYRIVRSPRSYNSQLGVPLSVWQMKELDQLAIFEAGISQNGEMEHLEPIIQCNIGVLGHIGTAHDEGFLNRKEKIEEKIRLFKNADTLIYRSGDDLTDSIVGQLSKPTLFSWSTSRKDATLFIRSIEKISNQQTRIEGLYKAENISLNIPFIDHASIENLIYCWSILLYLGYSADELADRFLDLQPIAMRLELQEAINDCLLINDSYNTDYSSLENALSFISQHDYKGKRTLILSDILESGQEDAALYTEVNQLLTTKKIDRLIGVGNKISAHRLLFSSVTESSFYSDTTELYDALNDLQFNNEVILLKGARTFTFEKIAQRLERKAHATTLEINLSALTNNLQIYSQYLTTQTKLMIMVKASAYGSGGAELSRMLESQPVDYLAVAFADEGVELREAGIQLPILVLNPEENSFPVMIDYQLEPEIYSLSQLKRYLYYVEEGQVCAIHLKLETGMHRLGFEQADLPALHQLISENTKLQVKSVFSHLSASDLEIHDEFTHQQVTDFNKMVEFLFPDDSKRPPRHILNTAGIVRFPQYQMEMVRLGIGLYGVDSTDEIKNQLIPVHRLRTVISQIKSISAGETLGYNRSGKAEKALRSGTISIGYADGLLRAAGNGSYAVLVKGKRASIIGNVCMDMCMIDLSEIPEAREGDEVIIFGPELPVEELANCLNTIPYEVFTNISPRVRRIYFQE